MDCSPSRLLCPWHFPGKNTGVGCHFLLQRIFLTQGLNLCLSINLTFIPILGSLSSLKFEFSLFFVVIIPIQSNKITYLLLIIKNNTCHNNAISLLQGIYKVVVENHLIVTCTYMAQMVKNPLSRQETWIGKITGLGRSQQWQPTTVFLPGEPHGQRCLAGYSPWGCKELDTTEQLLTAQHKIYIVQFSSVTQLCLTLSDPMNRSTPGIPVHHQLQEFTQTHVHQVGDAIQPSHPLLSPSPPAHNPSQQQGLFQ